MLASSISLCETTPENSLLWGGVIFILSLISPPFISISVNLCDFNNGIVLSLEDLMKNRIELHLNPTVPMRLDARR